MKVMQLRKFFKKYWYIFDAGTAREKDFQQLRKIDKKLGINQWPEYHCGKCGKTSKYVPQIEPVTDCIYCDGKPCTPI